MIRYSRAQGNRYYYKIRTNYCFCSSSSVNRSINARCSGERFQDSGTFCPFSATVLLSCSWSWGDSVSVECCSGADIFTPTHSRPRVRQQSRISQNQEIRRTRLYVSSPDPCVLAGFLKASLTSYYRNHLSFRHQTIGTINHQIGGILIKKAKKSQLIFWLVLINKSIVWSVINIWKEFLASWLIWNYFREPFP